MDFPTRYGPWALVTGASSGIGAHFAHALAERGLELLLVARRGEELERLAAELTRKGCPAAVPIPLDLTETRALDRIASATEGREIGLLVNDAGFGYSGPFLTQEPDDIRQMIRLNVEALALLTRQLLPPMVARGRGGLIQVASTAAYQPTPWLSVYGATKAFVLHLGEALAVELRGSGVDLLTVSPGHTETPFHARAGIQGPVAGHAASPEDVVARTLARLGRRRSSFVHGRLNAWIAGFAPRALPRDTVAALAGRMLRRRLPGDRP